jgi:membrane-associated phospholipid phosphatase
MRRYLLLVGTAGLLIAQPAEASDKGWDKASDVGRDVLVIAALGVPLVHRDVEGIGSAVVSQAATRVVTNRLKDWTNTVRPDESDNRSFPSGHASASFAAAATLHKRYGWKYGAPAYAVATFVGGARVAAHKHFVRDVFAGAALGTAGGWLLTRKQNEDVQWVPWASTKGAGVTIQARW